MPSQQEEWVVVEYLIIVGLLAFLAVAGILTRLLLKPSRPAPSESELEQREQLFSRSYLIAGLVFVALCLTGLALWVFGAFS
jgi:predicted MFS family arabinose efflux permease